MRNTQVVFVKTPAGAVAEDCFDIVTSDVAPVLDGQVLVRNLYLSCDPYMRGRMGANGFALGRVIPARVVGEVLESKHPAFNPGDVVWDFLGWETYTLVKEPSSLRKINPKHGPLSFGISVLGMPGLTAEVGMIGLGRPMPGDTVVVSAASGAVGQVAGQLAKLAGARVIGTVGSERKARHIVDELGFDAALDYRANANDLRGALNQLCPDGVDVYFDNVGGPMLEAVLGRLNTFARVPVCGQISNYNDPDNAGVRGLGRLVAVRATMTGFVIYDHMHRFDTFVPRMAGLLASGKMKYHEDIIDGIENTPQAFIGMMRGDNLGKRLVRVAPDPE